MAFAELTGKEHISPSQISTMLTCGMQYKFRYIEGIKSPPGVALVVGSGTHDGVEYNLTSKINTGELCSIEEISDVTAASVRKRWDDEEPQVNDGESRGKAVDQAVGLAVAHHKQLASTIDPKRVELKLEISVDGFPVDILGFADIEENTRSIRDVKTLGQKKQQSFIDSSLQLTFYDWAYEIVEGVKPTSLHFDVLVKNKKPVVQLLETERDEDDRVRFMHYAEYLVDMVERGAFHPAIPGSWQCSPRFCGYWDMCKYGNRQTKAF